MTWTAPEVPAALLVTDGPTTGPERPILAGYHAWQRSKFLQTCSGLTAAQLAAPSCPPSTLSLLGLVRHLRKVERIWWRIRLDREDVEPLFDPSVHGVDADFDRYDVDRAAEEFDALYAEWAVCDAVAARHDLDDEFDSTRFGPMSVRMLYVHLIGEYAQHNGHADLLRERALAATAEPVAGAEERQPVVSIARTFWETLDARDWEAFGATVTDDVEARWPQSRERVRGRAALVRFMAEFPGDWHLTVEREHADASGAATLIAFTVDGETVSGATFFDLAPDGRIAGFTEFWPDPYEPPPGREHLVERLPG